MLNTNENFLRVSQRERLSLHHTVANIAILSLLYAAFDGLM